MTVRGVVVECDFAVLDGAEILFSTAKEFLSKLDKIAFDSAIEARYLAGRDLQTGLAEYFPIAKTKKTAQKAARDLSAAFAQALDARLQKPLSVAFVNFVKALSEKTKVVISTHASPAVAEAAFAPLLGPKVVLHHQESTVYGSISWQDWRRTCVASGLNARSLAVTGSGLGVRSALVAGIAAVAVMNDHIAYQDFSGADEIFKRLDGPAAKRVLQIMHLA